MLLKFPWWNLGPEGVNNLPHSPCSWGLDDPKAQTLVPTLPSRWVGAALALYEITTNDYKQMRAVQCESKYLMTALKGDLIFLPLLGQVWEGVWDESLHSVGSIADCCISLSPAALICLVCAGWIFRTPCLSPTTKPCLLSKTSLEGTKTCAVYFPTSMYSLDLFGMFIQPWAQVN